MSFVRSEMESAATGENSQRSAATVLPCGGLACKMCSADVGDRSAYCH